MVRLCVQHDGALQCREQRAVRMRREEHAGAGGCALVKGDDSLAQAAGGGADERSACGGVRRGVLRRDGRKRGAIGSVG